MSIPMTQNTFKQAMIKGEAQFGAFMALGDSTAAELMATTGFDWLLLDGEHGPNDVKDIMQQLQAMSAYSVKPVVRMQDHDVADIKRVMDVGGQTLLIPMVETQQQAELLAQSVQYPPKGIRGMGGALTRATRWGSIKDYLKKADENICLILQIESPEGVTELDAITMVEGVDAIFLGPADLAAAMGFPGQPAHPDVCKVVERSIKRVSELGKPVGVYCGDPEQAKRYQAMGASFFLIGADTMLLKGAAEALVERFR